MSPRRFAWIAGGALALCLFASAPATAADCYQTAETCVEGPETRTIGGYPVQRDCWRYRASHTCVSQNSTDDCQPCATAAAARSIRAAWTRTPGRLHALRADLAVPRRHGHHLDGDQLRRPAVLPGRPLLRHRLRPDADFARAVAGLEAQREAGRYLDPNTLEVFRGYDNRCRKKLFGLVNCCKGGGTDGSLFSTFSLITGAGGQAIGAIGSSYTYDALFTAGCARPGDRRLRGALRRRRRSRRSPG